MKKNKILGIMARMMLSCNGATKLISKKQDSKLSMKEWFDLKMHLMTCYLCRRYDKQIQLISAKLELHKYIDHNSDHSSEIQFTLNDEQKKRLEKSIVNQSDDN